MRSVTAVQHCTVQIGDKERSFLLTRGGMNRLKSELKVEKDSDLLSLPAETVMIPLLLEAENPKTLTADDLPDLLPVDIEWTAKVVAAILGVSMPEPRPTTPETPANP